MLLKYFISAFGRQDPVYDVLSVSFSNYNTKSLFTPWKLGSIKWTRYEFWDICSTFDWYLFQLRIRLNLNLTFSSHFGLSWVDDVTTEM